MSRENDRRVPLAREASKKRPVFSESDADARLPKPVRPHLANEEKQLADGPAHLLPEETVVVTLKNGA